MPVRWLNWAMVSWRRCWVKARITARPRASEAMKLGSPPKAWISEAGVTGAAIGAIMPDGAAWVAGAAVVALRDRGAGLAIVLELGRFRMRCGIARRAITAP